MDEKTKVKIWETFKDKFVEEGISSPDRLVFQEKLPTEEELVNSGSILKKIGKFGKFVIWLIKKAVWVGGAIVIYAALPGAIEQICIRHPKAFEVINNINQAIKSYNSSESIGPASETPGQEQYHSQYVAFNDNWLSDEGVFLQDIEALNAEGIISDSTILAPAIGLEPSAIMHSDISVSSSDLT